MTGDGLHENQQVCRAARAPFLIRIIQSIPSSAAYFAKLDASHGYFQLPLDDEASRLTTFILPSGQYRYSGPPLDSLLLPTSGADTPIVSWRVSHGVRKLWTTFLSGPRHLRLWKIASTKCFSAAATSTSLFPGRNFRLIVLLNSLAASSRTRG